MFIIRGVQQFTSGSALTASSVMKKLDSGTDLDKFERWMHEIAAKRLKYKKKHKLQTKLDQDYLKRLSTKLDRPKYGLKKKKKPKKKIPVDRRKKIIYDKFSVPRTRTKPYTDNTS